MLDTKSILASRTVWSNLVGLLALALGFFGFEIGSADQAALVEACLQIVASACLVVSTFFRVVATKQLLG